MAQYNNYNEEQNKLAFRDWKVFIDNTSEWFDEINKKISACYLDTQGLKYIYPQIRTFASSRCANLQNMGEINIKLNSVKKVLYSQKYNELKKTGEVNEWDEKILNVLDEVIQLLSVGLSEGELTPKPVYAKELPYELEGNANDLINKSLTRNNNTSLNKDGKVTPNRN